MSLLRTICLHRYGAHWADHRVRSVPSFTCLRCHWAVLHERNRTGELADLMYVRFLDGHVYYITPDGGAIPMKESDYLTHLADWAALDTS